MLRDFIEAPEYTEQLQKLGDIRALDESLRAIMWGLHTQAEKYPFVPGFRTIRMAKSWRDKLSIIFQIQGSRILLKWIERLDEPGIFDDDEMKMGSEKSSGTTSSETPFARFQRLIRVLASEPKKEVEAEEAKWRADRLLKKKPTKV